MELGKAYHPAIIIHRALAVVSALQMYKENKVLVSMVFTVQFIYSYVGSDPYEVLKDS